MDGHLTKEFLCFGRLPTFALMILIADSGSTKCDWLLTNLAGERLGNYTTIGFNPLFQNSETVAEEILKNAALKNIAPKIEQVFYYGASTSSTERKAVIEGGLKKVFPVAVLHIKHDLLAAAYATYDGRPCISCILGTGSNSCYFDGENLDQRVPALGFVLGDEGSGAYFGKQLMTLFLYKKLPVYLATELETEYQLTKQGIFEAVYMQPRPNVYLAGFTPFIAKYQHEPVFAELLQKGFVHFVDEHVLCYENARQLPVHFVGSIASIFSAYLQKAAEQRGITIGNVITRPVEKLADYLAAGKFKL